MRFVWAVAAFVLAAVMIGAGIAQRTVFQGPKTETAAISVSEGAPYLLIDGDVLNMVPGAQTLRAQGDGEIFAAYGRTADMKAWLADTTYNQVSLDKNGEIVTKAIEPTAVEDETAAAAEAGATEPAAPVRSPVGSDLWLDEFQQEDLLIAPLQLPEEMSVLVAADGIEAAPAEVTVSWPIASATPLAGPLIVIGGILMVIGVFLYILGIRHARRSRGPRRKGLPLAATQPIDLAVEGADKGVISATPTRRSVTSGRRAFTVIPAVAVSALLFAGCSADSWPQLAGSPTPTPTATVIVPEGQQAPAVTEAQAERIIARIAATAADADAALDPTLAATRLTGAVLAERTTNYTLRAAIADYKAPTAIPVKPLEIVLPQAYDGWPRSVMAVVNSEADKTASIMLMTQADAWAPYKLTYLSSLEAATQMPDLAPAYVGAAQVPPDSSFLVMPPDQLAAAYADIINNGEASEFYDQFEAEGDQFRVSIAADRDQRLAEFNTTAASTGSLSFESMPGTHPPLALATLESGAIVAINMNEVDTVQPTNADAVIKLDSNPTVKTLAGAEQSATGFSTTFSDQLFFYVPGQGSSEKIRLLGYGSEILDAKVIS
ncbi:MULTISPECIES: glycosyl transferase [unclassified Microbacterium]|uniref:glycosyl transferase n=1 Tax=unclassified Microbacterium TaxID=2609290 RepID=UPI00214B90C4|nr:MULTISPECIES: glycosyl transferase [unclassified Microbacterium]MCR2809418.1 glycosyl transferase [Microbacterium sp. zg.B185]WIM20555.1 glycosyl transferase [Microbacterium sp. zg-B185]